MTALERLVEQALRDPLAVGRAHASEGGRVIGYAGAEVPVELILACGSLPVRLPVQVHLGPTSAERYLEAGFSAESRSIAVQYMDGAFDFMEAVIFPRSNDSLQRLYYYVCELQARRLCGGPTPLIYDLAKLPRDSSARHSRRATERLAAALGSARENLPEAIARRNRRRRLVVHANQLRDDGLALPGSMMDRAFRAADFCDADSFDSAFDEWLRAAVPGNSRARLVLVGNSAPDERLHRAVESVGGDVVAEFGEHPSCALSLPPITGDTFDSLADHYRNSPLGSRAWVDRTSLLMSVCKRARANGVIIWLLEHEDALIWDLPAQLSALAAAKLPVLALTRRQWSAEDGALDEIRAFTERIGSRH